METTTQKQTEKKVLKFQTGRGGRFNNAGHVTFVNFERIDEGMTFEQHFFDEETNTWFQASGNELDCEINDDGTGYVNVDHDYDTTHCVFEDDLSEKQINAIIVALNGEHPNQGIYWSNYSDLKRIIEEYYPEYLDEIKEEE